MNVLDRGFKALVKNRDIREQTALDSVQRYFAKLPVKSGFQQVAKEDREERNVVAAPAGRI